MRYATVIENAGNNFPAYVPCLPGCIATGRTIVEIERAINEAIEFHIDGLRRLGGCLDALGYCKLSTSTLRVLA